MKWMETILFCVYKNALVFVYVFFCLQFRKINALNVVARKQFFFCGIFFLPTYDTELGKQPIKIYNLKYFIQEYIYTRRIYSIHVRCLIDCHTNYMPWHVCLFDLRSKCICIYTFARLCVLVRVLIADICVCAALCVCIWFIMSKSVWSWECRWVKKRVNRTKKHSLELYIFEICKPPSTHRAYTERINDDDDDNSSQIVRMIHLEPSNRNRLVWTQWI